MRCVVENDPSAFLRATQAFRDAEPILTNVITTSAEARSHGRMPLEPDALWFHLVEDGLPSAGEGGQNFRGAEIGRTAGIAMLTPPHGMAISPMSDHAAEVLANEALARRLRLPGCVGTIAAVTRFAGQYCAGTGQAYEVGMPQRILATRRVTPPTGVRGSTRPATPADRDVVLRFSRGFHEDAHAMVIPPRWDELVERRLATPGSVWLWDVEGEPVSLCWQNAASGGVVRVGAVYTPPERRGHGYASANVAAMTQRALEAGTAACMLYTDATNPTSNKIYEQVGYELVAEAVELRFG